MSKARLRWHLRLLLMGSDAAVLLFAHAVAGALRFGDAFNAEAIKLFAVLLLFYTASAFAVEAYSTPVLLNWRQSVRRGMKALGGAMTGAVFLFFMLQLGEHVSRFTFGAAGLIAFAGLMASRFVLSRNAHNILGGNPYDVMLIVDGVTDHPVGGSTVFMDASAGLAGDQCPTAFDRLGRAVEGADRVVVACPPERRALWAAALQGANVQGEVIAPELAALHPLGIALHDGAPTLILAKSPLSLRDRLIKRGFDVALAGMAVIVLSPLLLIIALLISVTSPGPVLFRQMRIGRRNRQFRILKFRTMHHAETDSEGHRSTARDDKRVTAVGRVLRATSLDELPQLLNVLSGEMSIVGPRPHAMGSRAEEQFFWQLDERYWHRHAIKPGLTGLAQIRGLRGATVVRADLLDRLHADLEYRSNWSIWRDIAIVLRTAPVLFHRNAY